MKKNLLILSDLNLIYGTSAGVFRLMNYAKAVSKTGIYNVYLISTCNYKNNEVFIEIESGIFISSEKKSVVKQSILAKIKSNYKFAKSIFFKRKEIVGDVVFLIYPSTNFSFEFFLFLYFKIISKENVFCELNEIRKYSNDINYKSLFSIINWVLRLVKNFISEQFWYYYTGLICISSNIEKYAIRFNKNTIIIPILSDFDNIKLELSNSHKSFNILFTGSVSVKKENLIEFLSALVLLNQKYNCWTFEMCGPSTSADELFIRNFLKENKIENQVSFLGVLSHEKVLMKQQNAFLLVLPRNNNKQNYYGFSTKLSEYAISGTPILMTNTGVVSTYFIDNYNCYMVNGYNRNDFYEKLLKIFSLSQLNHNTIALNAYETAKENFAYYKYSIILTDFISKRS